MQLTKSEREILEAMKGNFELPLIFKGEILKNHQRHYNAVDKLKEKGLVMLNDQNIMVFTKKYVDMFYNNKD
ncbi:MAG: hypothetical protein KAT68_00595 [Bacteroidales bacterium]|nr:hypothetical protein [Bacteroidales bacterium]